MLGALLRNRIGSPAASHWLGARRAQHFIVTRSGAKIDIETEGSVSETGVIYWAHLHKYPWVESSQGKAGLCSGHCLQKEPCGSEGARAARSLARGLGDLSGT